MPANRSNGSNGERDLEAVVRRTATTGDRPCRRAAKGETRYGRDAVGPVELNQRTMSTMWIPRNRPGIHNTRVAVSVADTAVGGEHNPRGKRTRASGRARGACVYILSGSPLSRASPGWLSRRNRSQIVLGYEKWSRNGGAYQQPMPQSREWGKYRPVRRYT